MKKQILAAAALMATLALSGCGDDGIYGTYENAQYGAVLDVQKDVIKFRGESFPVKSWDESQKPTYIAKTQHSVVGSWTFKLEKTKDGGVIYQGTKFKKD
ncbi:hypothetical protein FML58_27480 [Klebsiella pneumoniae]|uniref:Lipoprotein n=4 Tax=Enterobacteriaceae TaxID=543 RepID=A0AA42R0I5_ENTCL|nr:MULTISPECIES: hypothetical protein [Enterobacterales]EAM7553593.1 hypothetical protein [Salmonella enterica]ECJ4342548.1 hypothetical protein [Salmonella enterica subsp. enterica serovar Concord]ECL3879597.1 hypothetical protein [Salmonella enterica subsp. enterica]ECN7712010.1 hypothetical protein [Salmonella enterica subsp. enterica serovar Enteritidis]EDS3894337.1 hypothetical protein [Salmonella enterica subsp. enterica serovar Reading]EFM2835699.1 hypothetical protein [Salmonella ente